MAVSAVAYNKFNVINDLEQKTLSILGMFNDVKCGSLGFSTLYTDSNTDKHFSRSVWDHEKDLERD